MNKDVYIIYRARSSRVKHEPVALKLSQAKCRPGLQAIAEIRNWMIQLLRILTALLCS